MRPSSAEDPAIVPTACYILAAGTDRDAGEGSIVLCECSGAALVQSNGRDVDNNG